MAPKMIALGGAAVAACTTLMTVTPARAGTGCNDVVNLLVWGCAPWDNNHGPSFPYYHKHQITVPAARSQIVQRDGATMVVYNGRSYPIVAQGGGNIVAQGGGNIAVWANN